MKITKRTRERGSAMIMAIFVLVLITMMGVALLFMSNNETKMSQSSVSTKQAFFLSEGGLEDGRTTLFNLNKASANPTDLTEELQALANDGSLDFDPDLVTPTYDSFGNVTGFTGYNDDAPVRPLTQFSDGWYAAWINNDPVEGLTNPVDTDDRVMVTALAVRRDGSREMVRALIERPDTFAIPPSTITILGPTPVFEGGKSNAKYYVGNDYGSHCPVGSAAEKPVVGVIGSTAETDAEAGVDKPGNFVEGGATGLDTVDDLTTDPNLPSLWTDCEEMLELAAIVKDQADVLGDSTLPLGSLGTPGTPKSVFITGDYTVSGGFSGGGLLWVTGHLNFDGMASWQGPIFVVGKGDFLRDGAGNGDISGGIVVADISGVDRVLFTGDDCAGPDGVSGNSDDGTEQSTYIVNGAGNSTTGYCSGYFTAWQSLRPFEILSFLQR